jgi:hypothetical protein
MISNISISIRNLIHLGSRKVLAVDISVSVASKAIAVITMSSRHRREDESR